MCTQFCGLDSFSSSGAEFCVPVPRPCAHPLALRSQSSALSPKGRGDNWAGSLSVSPGRSQTKYSGGPGGLQTARVCSVLQVGGLRSERRRGQLPFRASGCWLCVFTLCRETVGPSGVPSLRGLITPMKTPASRRSGLPKAPPLKAITWWLRPRPVGFGRTQVSAYSRWLSSLSSLPPTEVPG